ncbi:lipopolysaccharide biosynthesis protein [Cellulomonas iranensis]|uniref:O-antigen/teichoic acid export membrane protein n=1 Tax=Cellulomonas iranensis TaxID=76862 RepID=A0ABU0GGY1_9CELL|nr:oligosaccharide flippase family protein [Cellulomonas iranensis]MDQ0424601.1 O-antigen/teichoic acid export membrane protein [Cellulomonas iranensis]
MRWQSARLIGAQALGQLSLVAVIPVLTRHYDPGVFGAYQLALAAATLVQPVATLRIELVLPATRADDRVRTLLRRAVASTLAVTGGFVAACTYLALTGRADAALMTAMAATLVLVYGWVSIDNARLIRAQQVQALATRNLVAGLLSAVLQVGVALAGLQVVWLAAAVGIGRGVAVLLTRPRRAVAAPQPEDTFDLPFGGARAVRTVLSGLLSSTVLQLLMLVSGGFLGAAAAGYVGAAQRVTGAPASLIGQGVAQAVQVRFSRALLTGTSLLAEVRAVGRALAALSVTVAVGLALVAPLGSDWFFGPGWEPVKDVLRLLALPVALQLLVAPLNPLLVMIGAERALLRVQAGRLALSGGASAAAAAATGSLTTVVAVFAATTVVAYLGNLAVVVHQVRAHDATTLQQTPPAPATGHETVPALGAVHAAERTEGTR